MIRAARQDKTSRPPSQKNVEKKTTLKKKAPLKEKTGPLRRKEPHKETTAPPPTCRKVPPPQEKTASPTHIELFP